MSIGSKPMNPSSNLGEGAMMKILDKWFISGFNMMPNEYFYALGCLMHEWWGYSMGGTLINSLNGRKITKEEIRKYQQIL